MTYQEKVHAYIKEKDKDNLHGPFVLLLSVPIAALYAIVFVNRIPYISESFGATFFFVIVSMGVFAFSLMNLYYLKLLFANIGFKKTELKAYVYSTDSSLELMIAKSAFAPLFVFMTFEVGQDVPIEGLLDLFVMLVVSLIVSFILAYLLCILALFLFVLISHNVTETDTKKPVMAQSSTLFATEWDSLYALLHEAKRKDLLDLETEHGLNVDMERLNKTIQLFARLSAEKQGVMQEEILSMFLQVEKNIQVSIDTQDAHLMQEIKKQQLLLNK